RRLAVRSPEKRRERQRARLTRRRRHVSRHARGRAAAARDLREARRERDVLFHARARQHGPAPVSASEAALLHEDVALARREPLWLGCALRWHVLAGQEDR